MRAASVPPAEQVRLLPSTFHTAVVHAAFPSIDADRSVRVDASDLKYAPFEDVLWPTLFRITSFRRTHMEGSCEAMSAQAAIALGSGLSSSSLKNAPENAKQRLQSVLY